MPFNPTDFAFTPQNIPAPTQQGFTEEDLPPTPRQQGLPGFTEENLPPTPSQVDPAVIEFVKGATGAASDETLADVPKTLQDPEAVNLLLRKAKTDASDEGGFTDSLTSAEKIALGMLAILPVIGGAIGGEEGALIGVGAGGQGLVAGGKVQFARDKALGAEISKQRATSAAKKSEDRKLQRDVKKDWRKDKIRQSYINMKGARGRLSSALSGKIGLSDVAAITLFLKVLDEGSVAREGEVALVQASQSIKGRIENLLNIHKGRRLSDEAKHEIRRLSDEMVSVHGSLLKDRASEFRQEATNLDLNPDDIVTQQFIDQLPSFKPAEPSRIGGRTDADIDTTDAGIKSFLETVKSKDPGATIPTSSGDFEVGSDGLLRLKRK
jgi:hypothetical protein